MARADSIVRGLLNRGKAVRNIEEPWWSKRYGSMLEEVKEIPGLIRQAKQFKQQKQNYEMMNIANFESRLNKRVDNAVQSGDIYTPEGVSKLRTSIGEVYNQQASRNPEIISELDDYYETVLSDLTEYSAKNTKLNNLIPQVPNVKQDLHDIVVDLSKIHSGDFSPADKIAFRKRVNTAVENIVKLKKLINDPYYKRREDFADIYDNVNNGVVLSGQELLKQINMSDPDGYVINTEELSEMETAIFNNDATGIMKTNLEDAAIESKKIKGWEAKYTGLLKGWEAVNAFSGSIQYKTENERLHREYNKMTEEEQNKVSDDYWQIQSIDVPGLPDEGINSKDVALQLHKIQSEAEEIDAKYTATNKKGYTLTEVLDIPLPWAGTKKDKDYKEKFVPTFTGEVGETPTAGQKVIDKLVAEGKVFGEPDIGETAEITEEDKRKLAAPFEEEKKRAVELYAEEPRVKVEMNNPGNLKFADQTDATGKTPAGFATFDTADAGWQALYNQIDADKGRNDTLKEFIYGKPDDPKDPGGYTATDREVYLKNLSRSLNLSPNAKIDTVSTKKLANAIAKQEGWKGDFPEIEEEPKVKRKAFGVTQLTEEIKGKRVVDYGAANTPTFKRQQVDLQNIASSKFKSLSKEDKKKHGNVRDFVKSKFEEWIKQTGKLRKANWKTKDKYAVKDFQYFIPTSVNTKGEMRPKGSLRPVTQYEFDLFDPRVNKHPAFKRAGVLPGVTTSRDYEQFAKDFDDFRKYLQEL